MNFFLRCCDQNCHLDDDIRVDRRFRRRPDCRLTRRFVATPFSRRRCDRTATAAAFFSSPLAVGNGLILATRRQKRRQPELSLHDGHQPRDEKAAALKQNWTRSEILAAADFFSTWCYLSLFHSPPRLFSRSMHRHRHRHRTPRCLFFFPNFSSTETFSDAPKRFLFLLLSVCSEKVAAGQRGRNWPDEQILEPSPPFSNFLRDSSASADGWERRRCSRRRCCTHPDWRP